jgi:hypothetical protein
MCLQRAPEKYIVGAALDRAGIDNVGPLNVSQPYGPSRSLTGIALLHFTFTSSMLEVGIFAGAF